MTTSLRDQLLGLGFKDAPKPERRDDARDSKRSGHDRKPQHAKPESDRGRNHRPARGPRPDHAQSARPAQKRSTGEMDLAKAYAIRAQKEKDERIEAERVRQEQAARRREGKQKLIALLKTASLNDAAAEIARHFDYGGKIRRIYVTPAQLKLLNAGELAVVQQGGHYHLVTLPHADEAEQLLPGALALRVDPEAPASDDPYADSQFQVPDDLVW